jgi:hypothetical protein
MYQQVIGSTKIRGAEADGQDASNLLHQTRCMTYDQLEYNSKDTQLYCKFDR